MKWSNYHTHTRFCDGVGEPAEYLAEARRRDMAALGISSHAPVPFETDWEMPSELLDEYCRVVRALRDESASDGGTTVLFSLEIDYIPNVTGPREQRFEALGLDYVIGSVHFQDAFADGEQFSIDGPEEEFLKGLQEIYDGDIRALVERYYALVREMVRTQPPDILGHLDVIKKNNAVPGAGRPPETCFSESADWYGRAVEETLDAIAEAGVIVEINTGGLARGRTDSFYPSDTIIRQCRRRDSPMTISADAHAPDQVDALFPEAAARLRSLGYETIMTFQQDQWRPVSLPVA